eukprot:CAMPEP_0184295130 /NCGR_PEP_ID=MMETSP1049-20130417/6091_1 /TAXON_ID=77928 /ORGANISM="Proteomonas sulcata, Strain CCMP704" /LENGTH=321 /DNA_ID=CAMNT_0026603575 /DNA_START=160 /DNA_END=1125 /DNA_ORIENTATION=-
MTSVAPEPPAMPTTNDGAKGVKAGRLPSKVRAAAVRSSTLDEGHLAASRNQGAGVSAAELGTDQFAACSSQAEARALAMAQTETVGLNVGWGCTNTTRSQPVDADRPGLESEVRVGDGSHVGHNASDEWQQVRRKLDFSEAEFLAGPGRERAQRVEVTTRTRSKPVQALEKGDRRQSIKPSKTEKELARMLNQGGQAWMGLSDGDSDPDIENEILAMADFERQVNQKLGQHTGQEQREQSSIRTDASLSVDDCLSDRTMSMANQEPSAVSSSKSIADQLRQEIEASKERTMDHLQRSRAPTRPSSRWRSRDRAIEIESIDS